MGSPRLGVNVMEGRKLCSRPFRCVLYMVTCVRRRVLPQSGRGIASWGRGYPPAMGSAFPLGRCSPPHGQVWFLTGTQSISKTGHGSAVQMGVVLLSRWAWLCYSEGRGTSRFFSQIG